MSAICLAELPRESFYLGGLKQQLGVLVVLRERVRRQRVERAGGRGRQLLQYTLYGKHAFALSFFYTITNGQFIKKCKTFLQQMTPKEIRLREVIWLAWNYKAKPKFGPGLSDARTHAVNQSIGTRLNASEAFWRVCEKCKFLSSTSGGFRFTRTRGGREYNLHFLTFLS